MSARDRLKLALKTSAGLPPAGPTDAQLDAIIKEVEAIKKTREPTKADWVKVAHKYVPNGGKYKYAGEDLADLNYLLVQLQSTKPVVTKPASGGTK